MTAADVIQEIAENPISIRSVTYLGMKLEAVDRAHAVFQGRCVASVGGGQGNEIAAGRLHLIAVAHPNGRRRRHAGEKGLAFLNPALGAAKFATRSRLDVTTEDLASELHAIANAQNRDAKIEESGVAPRGIRLVNACGAAGKNEAARLQLGHPRRGQIMADDPAKHVQVAQPPAD